MAPTDPQLWSPAPKAVLFDIDGTLVDSNYLHVDAWARAFEKLGRPVDSWRIHRSIGLDSERLLDALLGDDVDEFGDRAKGLHSEFYQASTDRLRPLPGAVDLLHALSDAGVRVVLATSAPEEELEILLGVLDSDDALYATTSSGDVSTAKPEPDIVNVALERAGADASEALFVGDAVWDVKAAARANLGAIGVRTGGISSGELTDAGALQVFDDAAAVLADFERR
ncbi:HAD family hydrolase [Agreia sp. VKM Ac-1783]|uniref:HAD family hydrolase n=1 Tax=Agreia sp. VKM Ac-1783 TaxID=1938889 RepID=UPI000A2AA982|nr:HAD family hydrolase [Agreia sp. VKM Ac-1783]SMQ71427.1 haloacid dehalogenase superfamily, subfamily IA, variant 3 with third motif having DD or ED/haloacid dehalogenase superfamily, subfamily IA, variant 1 with third motif having Dx(3-4)D or Dx(3-4)E [Agreia sp. VKM Ac-1783]